MNKRESLHDHLNRCQLFVKMALSRKNSSQDIRNINFIKNSYKIPTTNIILNATKLSDFPL